MQDDVSTEMNVLPTECPEFMQVAQELLKEGRLIEALELLERIHQRLSALEIAPKHGNRPHP